MRQILTAVVLLSIYLAVEETTCAICMNDVNKNTDEDNANLGKPVILADNRGRRVCDERGIHVFHEYCVAQQIGRKQCPLCRAPYSKILPVPHPVKQAYLFFDFADKNADQKLSVKELYSVLAPFLKPKNEKYTLMDFLEDKMNGQIGVIPAHYKHMSEQMSTHFTMNKECFEQSEDGMFVPQKYLNHVRSGQVPHPTRQPYLFFNYIDKGKTGTLNPDELTVSLAPFVNPRGMYPSLDDLLNEFFGHKEEMSAIHFKTMADVMEIHFEIEGQSLVGSNETMVLPLTNDLCHLLFNFGDNRNGKLSKSEILVALSEYAQPKEGRPYGSLDTFLTEAIGDTEVTKPEFEKILAKMKRNFDFKDGQGRSMNPKEEKLAAVKKPYSKIFFLACVFLICAFLFKTFRN